MTRVGHVLGTTTVGHCECAGMARATDPRRRPANPPRPRAPTTARAAFFECSTITPEASPGTIVVDTGTPALVTVAAAASAMSSTVFFTALSKSAG